MPSKKKKVKPNRNISRIDISTSTGKETHGWEVRFHRRGEKVEKFFADRKFGGKNKALAEARKFRDQQEKKLPPLTRKERAQILHGRNTSGEVGVRWQQKSVVKGDTEYTYWVACATWCPKAGVRKTRSFSCLKYGEDKAWELAVKARQKGLKEMED